MLGSTVAPLRRPEPDPARRRRRERGAAPPSMVIVSGVLVGLLAGVGLERIGFVDPLDEPVPAVVRIDRVTVVDCPGGTPVAALARGDEVLAIAHSEDGEWLEIRSPVRQDQRAWLPAGVVGGPADALASQLPVRECGEVETTTTSSTTSTTSTTTTSTTSTTTTSTTTTTTPTTTTRPDAPTDVGILAVTGRVGGVTPPSSTTSSSTPSTSSTTSTTAPGTSTTVPAGGFHYVHALPAQGGASCPSIATLRVPIEDADGVARVRVIWSTGAGGATAIVDLQRGAGTEWGTAMQFPSIAVPGTEEHRVPTFELEVTDGNGVLVRTAAQLAQPFRIYGATALPCDR
jgi:hypothetical protein